MPPDAAPSPPLTVTRRQTIPWRVIWAAIGSVVLTIGALMILGQLHRVLVWILVAAFLSIVLNPAVDFLVHRFGMRRGLATTVVFLAGLAAMAAVMFAFVQPLVTEGGQFVDDLPRYVDEARHGEGPVGGLVTRFDLERRLTEQQENLRSGFSQLGTQSVKVLGAVGTAIAGTLTVLVLTVLMLLDGPRLLKASLGVLPPEHRERVSRVAADCSKAVTGYMFGNVLISLVAGVSTYIMLWALGVPYKGVLAIFVGLVDLIPLVGATLGAVVVILVAAIHSPTAGIVALIFFVLYQQVENHVLQPVIQARTVKLSPLVVLVSALIGVELAGLLGALLAIPVAGVIKVLGRDLWDHHRGEAKEQPTVGEDQLPVATRPD